MRSIRSKDVWCCAAFLLTCSTYCSAQTYKIIGQYKAPGATVSGLAVDTTSRQLFVAGSDGISVLNVDTGAAAGQSMPFADANAVLLVPEEKDEQAAPPTKGFAANSKGEVAEFSLADMKILSKAKLPTGGSVSLCYDDAAKTVAAVSTGGSLASFDIESGKMIHDGRIATGAGEIACGTLHHVFVADTAAGLIRVLNDATLKDEGDIPLAQGSKPSGLALDTKGRRLFVGCEDGTIDVIDTDAGFTFIELKGGTGAAHELFTWLPQGKGQWKAAAFIAQADGTLSAVKMNAYINYSLGGTYKLQPGLSAIAYDEKTHHLLIGDTKAGAPTILVVGY